MAGGLCQAKDAGVKHIEFGGGWEEAGESEEERNVKEQRNVQPLRAERLVGSLMTLSSHKPAGKSTSVHACGARILFIWDAGNSLSEGEQAQCCVAHSHSGDMISQ